MLVYGSNCPKRYHMEFRSPVLSRPIGELQERQISDVENERYEDPLPEHHIRKSCHENQFSSSDFRFEGDRLYPLVNDILNGGIIYGTIGV